MEFPHFLFRDYFEAGIDWSTCLIKHFDVSDVIYHKFHMCRFLYAQWGKCKRHVRMVSALDFGSQHPLLRLESVWTKTVLSCNHFSMGLIWLRCKIVKLSILPSILKSAKPSSVNMQSPKLHYRTLSQFKDVTSSDVVIVLLSITVLFLNIEAPYHLLY